MRPRVRPVEGAGPPNSMPATSSSCRVPTRAAREATGLEWLLLRRAQAKVHIKDLTKHMDTTNLAVHEARDLQEMVEWCGTRGGRQLGRVSPLAPSFVPSAAPRAAEPAPGPPAPWQEHEYAVLLLIVRQVRKHLQYRHGKLHPVIRWTDFPERPSGWTRTAKAMKGEWAAIGKVLLNHYPCFFVPVGTVVAAKPPRLYPPTSPFGGQPVMTARALVALAERMRP